MDSYSALGIAEVIAEVANLQNAAAQFTALMKCATDKGVDVNTLLTKTKSL